MVTKTHIPEGYQKTDVGVIPEDWETKPLKYLVEFTNGKAHENCITDYGRYVVVNSKFISTEGEVRKHSNNCFCPSEVENILMVMSDVPNGKAIAKCFYVDRNDYYTINQRICSLRVKNDDPMFLFYVLDRNKYFLSFDDGVKQTNLRKKDVLACPIPLPPTKAEQEAIAKVLSDADALVELLEKLIAKKRNIKQGTMQQLLTGKKRLPGFSGKWEVKRIGEMLGYERPDKYIVKSTDYVENGDIPVLTANKSFVLGFTNEAKGIYEDVPAIIFDDFTTDSKFATFPFKVKSSAIKILKKKINNIDLKYLFERMQIIRFPLGGHKRYYISEYQHINLEVPKFEEQQTIAKVLCDMDTEIEALEKKRNKYKAVKQGMMQELLTGKTRLI